MAKETVVLVWDDLAKADGKKVPATETIVYAIDDQAYSIDLSEGNAAEMRETLGRYIAVSDKLGRQRLGDARQRPIRPAPVRTVQLPPHPEPPRAVRGTKVPKSTKPADWQRGKYRARAVEWVAKNRPGAKTGRLSDALYTEYEEHCRQAGIDP
jgi:hypothetical protein